MHLSNLINLVKNGQKYKDGQTIQCGFMWFKVSKIDGTCKLLCPDFKSIPINWTENLHIANEILDAQHAITKQYKGDHESCHICDTLITLKYLIPIRQLFMMRDQPTSDSGWFLGDIKSKVDVNDPKNLQKMTIYEASVKYPVSINYYNLPLKYAVTGFNKKIPNIICEFAQQGDAPDPVLPTP